MKATIKHLLCVCALATSLGQSLAIEGINHEYRISGDPTAMPLQAFDNGKRLYLQLRTGARTPVPFAADGEPMSYELSPPYMILPIRDRIILAVGDRRSLVVSGKSRDIDAPSLEGTGTNVFYGKAAPVRETSVASRPVPVAVAEERLRVQGHIEVSDQPPPKAAPVPIHVSVKKGLTAALSVEIADMAKSGAIKIMSDGTLKGYRLAKKIAGVIEKSTGRSPEVVSRGADSGQVRVVAKGD